MTHTPLRFGAIACTLAVGFGLGTATAQTVADSPSAADANAAVPVASVAPASAGRPLDISIAPKDAHGRHMAPHDTFYLLEYVSAMTDKGVEGFEPGQEVHFVSADRAKHTLVVSDGRAQVEVEPSKLTNDMDIAALVRQKDERNQARIAAYVQAEQSAYNKAEKEAADATAKDLQRHDQEQAASTSVGGNSPSVQPEQPQDTAVSENAYSEYGGGGYGYGGYGYGSPYSYFVDNSQGGSGRGGRGGRGTTPAAAPAAPAAPAGKVGVGSGAVGGGAVGSTGAATSGGAAGGRPK